VSSHVIAPAETAGPLWTARHRAGLGLALVLAGAGVLVGWIGTANSPATDDAVRWVVLTVLSLVLAVFAGALWVLALRRRIGLRRAALLPAVTTSLGPGPTAPRTTDTSDRLVATARMRYFHRPDCRLVRNKDLQVADRAAHANEGRSACPVCAP
jgi:hypothetical protein